MSQLRSTTMLDWRNVILCVVYMTLCHLLRHRSSASSSFPGYVQLDVPLKNISRYEGETVRIKCEITGYPLPRYRWFRGGRLMEEDTQGGRISIKTTHWGSRLKIDNLQMNDTDYYGCEGFNSFGQQNTSGKLTVVDVAAAGLKGLSNNSRFQVKDVQASPFDDSEDDEDEVEEEENLEIVYVEDGDTGNSWRTPYKQSPRIVDTEVQSISRQEQQDQLQQRQQTMNCQSYRGSVCSAVFGNSTSIFPAQKNGRATPQSLTEQKLNAFLAIVVDSPSVVCRQLAVAYLCRYLFPRCDQSSIRQMAPPLCKNDCATFRSSECTFEYEAVRSFAATENRTNNQQDCSKDGPLSGATDDVDEGPTTCVLRSTSAIRNDPFVPPNFFLYVVVAGVTSCLAIAIIVLVIRHRKRHRQTVVEKKKRQNSRADSFRCHEENQAIFSTPSVKMSLTPTSHDRVALLWPIGTGHFGTVFVGELSDTGPSLLSKPIPTIVATLSETADPNLKLDFYREMEMLAGLRHPNILSAIAICRMEMPICILYEYMEGIDLHRFLQQSVLNYSSPRRPIQPDLMSLSVGIARGLEYLSMNGYVHGDLAARNILVSENGENAKITNVGISKHIYSADYCATPCGRLLPVRWSAPETLIYGAMTTEADVWSFGVVLWEIFSYAARPYLHLSDQEVLEMACHGPRRHLAQPEACPNRAYAVMVNCWNVDPDQRLQTNEICSLLESLRSDENSPDRKYSSVAHGNGYHDSSSHQNSPTSNDTASTNLASPVQPLPDHISFSPSSSGIPLDRRFQLVSPGSPALSRNFLQEIITNIQHPSEFAAISPQTFTVNIL